MIIWSHLKTMVTSPGYIEMGNTEYDSSKLPVRVRGFMEVKEIKRSIDSKRKLRAQKSHKAKE